MEGTRLKSHRLPVWACLLLLLLCCCAAFWPLSFYVYSLKNDALNYFLPVRHQVSEAYSQGYWPFWSPYFNLGYPLQGDMQSGVWNPFVQLLSLFGPYTLRTLQIETLLYVYLSGVGMFFLARHFVRPNALCLLAATGYMLCGFNTDSAQFLNWISAASFLPFVFLFYYRTLTESSWRAALCTALFLNLLFTTAYPADFILTAYLMLALLLWQVLRREHRNRRYALEQLRLQALILIPFLLLSLPAILSFAEYLPLTQRGTGASYAQAMSNFYHPLLLLSWITPLPAWKAPFAWATDPLERNSFFGLVTLLLFLCSLFIRYRNPVARFLKWGFLLAFLFSLGEWGGLRVLAYYALPLMNTFRHPANAKLFTIFFACLLAAFALGKMMTEEPAWQLRRRSYGILLLAWAFLLIVALIETGGGTETFSKLSATTGGKSLLDTMSFGDLLLLNSLLQLPFLAALYFFFYRALHLKALVVLSLCNCMLHAALYQPFSVVKKDRAPDIQRVLDSVQRPSYPLPDLNATVASNSEGGEDLFNEIGTSNLYNKKIGRVDYRISPSNLLKQNEFWFNTGLRNRLLSYPLFYRADTIAPVSDSARMLTYAGRFALVDSLPARSGLKKGQSRVRLIRFNPLCWDFEIESDSPGYYVLFQNHYPRWRLYRNSEREPLIRTNVAFMGFSLPAGKQRIRLCYQTQDLSIAFYISVTVLAIILLLVLRKRKGWAGTRVTASTA